jgi:hypothetical protein
MSPTEFKVGLWHTLHLFSDTLSLPPHHRTVQYSCTSFTFGNKKFSYKVIIRYIVINLSLFKQVAQGDGTYSTMCRQLRRVPVVDLLVAGAYEDRTVAAKLSEALMNGKSPIIINDLLSGTTIRCATHTLMEKGPKYSVRWVAPLFVALHTW